MYLQTCVPVNTNAVVFTGVCRCAAGYSGLQCEVSAADTIPTLLPPAATTCGCDRRATDDCRTVTLFGDNFVESETLTCHYEFTQVWLTFLSVKIKVENQSLLIAIQEIENWWLCIMRLVHILCILICFFS